MFNFLEVADEEDLTGLLVDNRPGELLQAYQGTESERLIQEARSDLLSSLLALNADLRRTLATNIDIKFNYYSQQQTYQHMQVITRGSKDSKTQEAELCKYLRLMIAKVLLHIRTGQAGHVYDIFVSLFDIVNDTEILGIRHDRLVKPQ